MFFISNPDIKSIVELLHRLMELLPLTGYIIAYFARFVKLVLVYDIHILIFLLNYFFTNVFPSIFLSTIIHNISSEIHLIPLFSNELLNQSFSYYTGFTSEATRISSKIKPRRKLVIIRNNG